MTAPRLQNLSQLLLASAENHAAREAIVEGSVRLDYAGYLARARLVARRLRARGIEPGDRVALLVQNGWRCAVAYFGVQLAGGIAVMVNTRLVTAEVAFILANSGARLVLSDDELSPRLAESADVPRVDTDALTDVGAADETEVSGAADATLPGLARAGSDIANILYTSGTTGRPKGAMITHANLLANARRLVALAALRPDDRTLVIAPMFHATAVHSQLLGFALAGATLVFDGAFSTGRCLALIAEERVTVFAGVSTMLGLMLRHRGFSRDSLASLRLFIMGGSPVPPPLLAEGMRALPALKFANVWGLTEATSIVTFCAHEAWAARPWSVGPAVADVELGIVAEGTDEPRDQRDVVGELCVRGDIVTAGYWCAPEATAAAFRDGWLHTGDVGRIDADGYVEVLDRLKDMIIRGGENIYCLEVENALASHASVAEVAVVGVPDPLFGERVRAAVVVRAGAELSAAEVEAHAASRLADYKVPVEYLFLPELPRNPGGKVQKRVLAALAFDEPPRRSR